MKYLLLLIFVPSIAFSQKKSNNGYAYLAATAFISPFDNGFGNSGGIAAGAGFAFDGKFSIGAALDALVIREKDNPRFGTAKFAFGYFFKGIHAKMTPFISAEPGLTIASKPRIVRSGNSYEDASTKGGFAFDGMAGFRTKTKGKAGFYFSIGYSHITIKTGTKANGYDGAKAKVGIAF